jgi:hypothetical protein
MKRNIVQYLLNLTKINQNIKFKSEISVLFIKVICKVLYSKCREFDFVQTVTFPNVICVKIRSRHS